MTPTLRTLDDLKLPSPEVLHQRAQIPLLAQESSDILALLAYVDRRRERAQQEADWMLEGMKVERRAVSANHRAERKALAALVTDLATEPLSTSLTDIRRTWTTEIGPQVDRRIKDMGIFVKPDPASVWEKEYAAAGMRLQAAEETPSGDSLDEYVQAADVIRTELLRLESEAKGLDELRQREADGVDIYEIESAQARLEVDYFGPGTVVDDTYDWPLLPHSVVHRLERTGVLTSDTTTTGLAG
jgi:hypothetical protein